MDNLKESLAYLSKEELSVLQKIVNSDVNSIESIISKLEKILRLKILGYSLAKDSYIQILNKIANHHNILLENSTKEVDCERELYLKLFKKELDLMSAEEKEAFYTDLEKQGLSRAQVASLSGLATIGAAQASGFGVYLLASSTVGAIASVVGVTLPFAFYTGMSTVISYAIGPLGFLVLGYSAYKNVKSFDDLIDIVSNSYTAVKKILFGDYERATLSFKYIAAMRFVLESNYEIAVEVSNSKLQEFEKNKNILNEQIVKNNADLKIIHDEIFVHEQKLKALNSEKATIIFKISEVQNKIKVINNNQSETQNLKNNQTKKLADFKSILSK